MKKPLAVDQVGEASGGAGVESFVLSGVFVGAALRGALALFDDGRLDGAVVVVVVVGLALAVPAGVDEDADEPGFASHAPAADPADAPLTLVAVAAVPAVALRLPPRRPNPRCVRLRRLVAVRLGPHR